MRMITAKLIGFKDLHNKYVEMLVSEDSTVSQFVNKVLQVMGISEFNGDEIMVMCNDKQLYPDDKIPGDCQLIELFPFASGG